MMQLPLIALTTFVKNKLKSDQVRSRILRPTRRTQHAKPDIPFRCDAVSSKVARSVCLTRVQTLHLNERFMCVSIPLQMGNYFFWLTFCIFGQPACILLYYYDFVEKSEAQSSILSEASIAVSSSSIQNQTAVFDSIIEDEHMEL